MTADNLNNVRVIPDLLVINENVRPSKVAYRQFDDKSKTWIGVTWKEFADMVRSFRIKKRRPRSCPPTEFHYGNGL